MDPALQLRLHGESHFRKSTCRMNAPANPLPPSIHSTGALPKIAWAKGSYLHDIDGKQYIDGSGGPAVYCIGHSNTEVNEAIKRQLDRIAHGYRYNFTSDALEQLTEIISNWCGGSLKHVVFVAGGSEAVESCLKLALQYQTAVGQKSRRRFIARERSWHGNTFRDSLSAARPLKALS
jgi:adenosylmethionine-8-amino-7-oxononanoate aminotransferase